DTRFWAAVEGGDVRALATGLGVDAGPLAQVLPALASWRRHQRDRSATQGWRYRVAWAPAPETGPAVLSGLWLVLGPADQAEPYRQALTAHGATVSVVDTPPAPDRESLAGQLRLAADTRPAGIVSLLGLDEQPLPGYPVVAGGVAATLALVQALGDTEITAPLWALTRAAVRAGGEQAGASPVQAQVWGLGQVAGLEHPDRWGGLIDVPPVLDERAAARLCTVLAGCGEDQVAIRAGGMLARRLVRAAPPHADAPRWAPAGTVLVTGGTGGVGGQVARWLAGRGTPRVVLAARSGPAAAGAAALAAAVAGAGSPVTVLAADITQRSTVRALLTWIGSSGPPLTAVMHAAGTAPSTAVAELTVAGLADVLAAKVAGAAHLDELTGDLEAFVLFSSGAATWGSGGLAGYAAANAYLDALAQQRRERGQVATSVAWGLWGGGGLGEGEASVQLRRRGVRVMDPALAVRALGHALDGGETLLTVADVDWARFAPVFTAARPSPLIAGLPEVRQAIAAAAGESAGADGPAAQTALARRLAGRPVAEQDQILTETIRAEAAAVLGHESADAVGQGRSFRDLGFDSLMAVELRDRLNAATGLRLPATLVFDYPAPLAVARFVRAGLTGEAVRAAEVPLTAATGEPIAIVGMSCRYPGGADSPEGLWELLAAGRDAVSGLPPDRGWDAESLYHPDPDHPGTSYAQAGSFLSGAGDFDPGFFGISPREAMAMDPQQRLLLEVCWEAIERAGLDPLSLSGSRTGVFAGAGYSAYSAGAEEAGGSEGYLLTGNATAVISGRVSYTLGLEGPAVTVDTACSSSLVTLHLACQALRAGECELALAGGVAVMVTPGAFTEFSRQRGLAADGRCKAFGAAADGIGWSEGAGMVVLERLSDARRNGHRVLAVVRGSAVNQDGASNGLTAPNGPSQQRVIRAALAAAQLRPDQVDAVEAHGTGTTLGDPIEAQALLATYGQDRDRPLWLGSVKSNIGHAQTAAGIAGVVKMVLAMQHGELPVTLHAQVPSPHVDWSAGAVRLLTEPVPWAADGEPRRAGVSAFGVSGTNVHVILEAAGTVAGTDDAGTGVPAGPAVLTPGPLAWLVSAPTEAGLGRQAERLAEFVAARPDLDPADVGWSLATTRSAFGHRAVVTGAGRAELEAGLAALAAGVPAPGLVTGQVSGAGRVVFVFPGQGGQWAGMGRDLAAACPVFAARLAQCQQALAAYVDWDLGDVLAGADGAPGLDRVDVVQPALWAVMVSLAAAWQAAGVTPDAVAGHSQGEIAAATVAGILSVDDGAKVVALRSQALRALAGHGGMVSVAEPAAAVRDRIAGWGDRLAVAAVNGPSATVVSGEPAALAELAAACAAAGVRTRAVPVDYASHSPQVEAIRDQIAAALAGVVPGPALIPMVSAMTGQWLDGLEAEAGYWYDSLRAPVEFDHAVRVLAEAGHRAFIEVSPHPVLTTAVTQCLDEAADGEPAAAPAVVVAGTLRRDDGGAGRFLASLAEVHARGVPVDWAAVLAPRPPADLPTYAFARQRYWPAPARTAAGDLSSAGLWAVRHPLLSAAVEQAGGAGYLLTGRLSARSQPWLADHAVGGMVLLPGTAFVEMAVRAGDPAGCGRIEELTLEAPLVLPAGADSGPGVTVRIQVVVGGEAEGGRRPVQVYSRPDGTPGEGQWTRHASGVLAPAVPPGDHLAGEFAVWPPPGAAPVDTQDLYPALAEGGYGYGPAFRGLRAAWQRGADVFAEVVLPPEAAAAETGSGAFGLHPALLDAALHAAGLTGLAGPPGGAVLLPFAWTGVSLHATGALALRVRLRRDPGGALSLAAADGAGAPVVTVDALVLRPMAAGQLNTARSEMRDALFTVEWIPVTGSGPAAARCGLLGDDRPGLAAGLTAAGPQVPAYPDLDALAAAEPIPDTVLTWAPAAAENAGEEHAAVAARQATGELLGLVQRWLADERLGTARLVILTRGAVAAVPGDAVPDLTGAAAWGLIRAAQSENPGRLVVADLPAGGPARLALPALAAALTSGEPELAIRDGAAYGRRLARPAGPLARPGQDGPWRLEVTERGTLDGVALVPCPPAAAPLAAGQVRVAVRAAGVNFRDVLVALDMLGTLDPAAGLLGGDIAGMVTETGPGVTGLAAGDRVLGLAVGGIGPVTVADERVLVRVPDGWSFAQAASVPIAFMTAWYGLVDLAGARAGQRVLVHAAAGGVGMAAVSIGRYLGLEVYG
ncbi:MAG TPA: SDR family NAD(P)-dependent oxidoreductase, partial [Streptosporangiaceae bacterium]